VSALVLNPNESSELDRKFLLVYLQECLAVLEISSELAQVKIVLIVSFSLFYIIFLHNLKLAERDECLYSIEIEPPI
jgi:hypothetical protein